MDSARRAEETASTSTVPSLKRYSLVLAALPLGVAVSAHGQAGLLQNHYETRLHPREAWKTWEGIDLSVRMAATATYDDNITIRNLTLQRARVPDKNGAGIRAEGKDLLVDGVKFINNQNGILAAPRPDGTITIRVR